jgi:hypothetical protein
MVCFRVNRNDKAMFFVLIKQNISVEVIYLITRLQTFFCGKQISCKLTWLGRKAVMWFSYLIIFIFKWKFHMNFHINNIFLVCSQMFIRYCRDCDIFSFFQSVNIKFGFKTPKVVLLWIKSLVGRLYSWPLQQRHHVLKSSLLTLTVNSSNSSSVINVHKCAHCVDLRGKLKWFA